MASSFVQSNFNAGLDMFSERTKLPEGAYPLLINGRSRFGKVRPINKPLLLTSGLPAGNVSRYQGLYGVGNFAMVFANGRCWVRDFSVAESIFSNVAGFQMSPGAHTLWLETVPASSINYGRKLTSVASDVNPGNPTNFLNDLVNPSPQAAVIQDGILQPWIILSDGTARETSDYYGWQNNSTQREYVPVGKQMVYADGKLYITDGKQIFHSVSGRPLDFMVAIDDEGNKLDPAEEGFASNVSHRVFYDNITCLARVSTEAGGFYVGSPTNSFLVVPDYSFTIYGEPTFTNKFVTNTGPLNQFSFLGDASGDSLLIDGSSIKSFNSILQFRNAGKNSPFSVPISSLFDGVTQDVTAAGQYDNYSMFALNTVYGPAVVWYDELREVWDAVDIYSDVTGSIRQFAEIQVNTGERILLFLTTTGNIYQFGASSSVETCTLYLGDWSAGDPDTEMKMGEIKALFNQAQSAGTVTATLFVDNQRQEDVVLTKTIAQDYTASVGNRTIPFGDATERSINNLEFDFSRAKSGYKAGVMLQWNVPADLTYVSGITRGTQKLANTMKRQQSEYLVNKAALGLG